MADPVLGINPAPAMASMRALQAQALLTRGALVGLGVAAGALGGVALVAMARGQIQANDELAKGARFAGIAADRYADLGVAIELAGGRTSDLRGIFRRMSGAIQDGRDGLETYLRTFRTLGVSIEDLEGLAPDEQFVKLARALGMVADEGQRSALAQDLFGRSGDVVASAARTLSGDIEDLSEFTNEQALAAEKAADEMRLFDEAMADLARAVVQDTGIVGALGRVASQAAEGVRELSNFFGLLSGGEGPAIATEIAAPAAVRLGLAEEYDPRDLGARERAAEAYRRYFAAQYGGGTDDDVALFRARESLGDHPQRATGPRSSRTWPASASSRAWSSSACGRGARAQDIYGVAAATARARAAAAAAGRRRAIAASPSRRRRSASRGGARSSTATSSTRGRRAPRPSATTTSRWPRTRAA